MTNVVVTGSKGFLGKNLMLALSRRTDLAVFPFDVGDSEENLLRQLSVADVVYHLAGVNRASSFEEFRKGNVELTRLIVDRLVSLSRSVLFVLSSSVRASGDDWYAVTKREAEREVTRLRASGRSRVWIYRLSNVFGKWSRPFYNSVVATFCHQAARGEPLTVHDPSSKVRLIYIDDVISSFLNIIDGHGPLGDQGEVSVSPVYEVTVGELAERVTRIAKLRTTGLLPELSDDFTRKLNSTFLSYVDPSALSYSSQKREDDRGYLFELLKSRHAGQIFVSRTIPGVTRGNHLHDTKVEKFCVLEGIAQIDLRNAATDVSQSFVVRGEECEVIDIPPGWAHKITNVGEQDLIALFWASEIFDPERPDTYPVEV